MDCPKRNVLAGLPDEAVLEILARAPFRSICRSKCVTKAWRDLISDPLNRGMLPQTLEGFFFIFYPMTDWKHFFVKNSVSSVPLDIEPCLSFLKLPEIENLYFLDSCNGLLLLEHCRLSNPFDVVEYIVCNPATKHWATVPVCVFCPPAKAQSLTETYLIFDPARAVSPRFHVIQFWMRDQDEEAPVTYEEIQMLELSVHTYSSESGVWSHSQTDWNDQGQLEGWRRQGSPKYGSGQRTFVNGILHLVVTDLDQHQIVAVDVQGRTKKIITIPAAAQERRRPGSSYIGQSQGLLHYINQDFEGQDSIQVQSYEVSIWVLQDYDTQEWVLKDTTSFRGPFGRMTDRWDFVVIHPDRNVVFFFQRWLSNEKSNILIAYDMDRKEVSAIAIASFDLVTRVVPYIPYFLESPALTNKN